ncbi:MAG: glycosyltransferase family 4 protein [Candidatus Eisenbacteria bacterium]
MDIAFVVRRFDRGGGIARYTTELAERLSRTNTVTVYAAAWDERPDTGIRFVRVPFVTSTLLQARHRHAWNTLLEVGSFTRSAAKVVNRSQHDILHSQGDYAHGTDVLTAHSCHKAWLHQARLVAGGPIGRLKKSRANPLHALVLHAERIGITESTRVVAISERIRSQIVEQYGIPAERIAVIHHGVDTVRFHPENRRRFGEELRSSLGIGSSEIVAIFPAHEFRRKGLGVLIESLRRLPATLSLLVVGRDDPRPYRSRMEQYGLLDRVRFVGDAPDIERWYAAADLMVFPTAYDAFGLVITEAMASGLPVVTSRDAGAAELISDGEDGLLLSDPSDVDAVTASMRRLVEDAGLRERIGRRGRERAEMHSWDRACAMTLDLYKIVAREKEARRRQGRP